MKILSEQDGLALLDWLRENGWRGGAHVLVSERAYTGRVDPVWLRIERWAPGSAAVYPLKARCTNGANGQWAVREVLAVGLDNSEMDTWREHARQGSKMPPPLDNAEGWNRVMETV